DPSQQKYLEANGIEPLDFVVVNLYPFQEVVKADPENLRRAVDNIDIGGVALIRAAGKGALLNHRVVPVTSPLQYEGVVAELEVWDESPPESRIVQSNTFPGRDWKSGMGQMGKGRTIGDEYRGWESWVANRRIFWRAGGSGDEASQSIRSFYRTQRRTVVLCLRSSPRCGSQSRFWERCCSQPNGRRVDC